MEKTLSFKGRKIYFDNEHYVQHDNLFHVFAIPGNLVVRLVTFNLIFFLFFLRFSFLGVGEVGLAFSHKPHLEE